MYQKKIKQLTAAVLCAAMVMGQTPTAYAASDDDEMLVIMDGGETELSQDDESFDELSNDTSEDIFIEDIENADDASVEASEVAEDISSEDSSTDSDEISVSDDSEEASSVADETPAEENAELLPEGVVGMPEGYVLTSEEKETKLELASNTDALDMFSELTEGVDYISDQVVCVTETREHAEEIAAAYSGELASYEYGVAVIDLSDSVVDVATAYELAFDKSLNLPVVEPNYVYHLIDQVEVEEDEAELTEASDEETAEFEATGSWKDMKFNDKFLNPSEHFYQWHHDMIGTYDAWKVTTGGNYSVTVAVIDSGVQAGHPELTGRVKFGIGGTDGDGHGTHVAGIIAASANNGVGGAGIAPKTNILSCQVFDENGRVTSDDAVLKAIRYVAGYEASGKDTGKRRADIANLSLGGPVYDQYEQNAINLATERGVTIIAAMGNELSNHKAYPAAFNNVIAVGAVTETGKRTYFSCYGPWQDIAAPGTDIVSSFPTGLSPERYTGTGYEVMDGTSQATPIVAGACALYMSYVGHVEPYVMLDALQRSSDKGIVNVGKLMKSAAPQTGNAKAKNVTSVTIQNDPSYSKGYNVSEKKGVLKGATLYLGSTNLGNIKLNCKQVTKSGSAPTPVWKSSNNQVATVASNGLVKAVSKGKVTITCISTDGSNKKASVTINVAQQVTEVRVSGQTTVTPGSKANFKASVYPVDANNKKVTYTLDKPYTGVNIDAKSGKLTVAKDAKAGSFTVRATSTDPETKSGTMTVTVKTGAVTKTSKVTISKPSTTTLSTAKKGSLVTSVTLSAKAEGSGANIIWQSSNEKVAKLSTNLGGSVTVTAVSAGKAKITAMAADGSKKKAEVALDIINPVASIHLVPKAGNSDFALATGCSTSFTAVLGDTYGKPSNKKVNWTYEIYGKSNKGLEKLNSKAQEYIRTNHAFFTVNNKGKVTADSNSRFDSHIYELKKLGANYSDYAVVVKCTAADGSGSYDEKTLYKVPRNYALMFHNGSYRASENFYAPLDAVGIVYVNANYYELAVESSNPDIASAYLATLTINGERKKVIRVECNKRGTAKITVKTVDGSGVSGSFNFTVR